MQKCSEEQHIVSIVEDRLLWILSRQPPRHKDQTYCFNTEEMLFQCLKTKEPQPPSFSIIAKFIIFLTDILKDPSLSKKQIFYHCPLDQRQKANTCFLIVSYQIVVDGKTPEDAFQKFKHFSFPTYGSENSMTYSVFQAVKSIYKTFKLGLFNFKPSFIQQHQKYRSQKNGTIVGLIPRKIVVFQWPEAQVYGTDKYCSMSTKKYAQALKQFNVTDVVQIHVDDSVENLNTVQLKRNGLIYHSVTTYDRLPQLEVVRKVCSIIEKEGVYAIISQDDFCLSVFVSCVYMLKKYSLKPVDVIPLARVMCPDSMTPIHIDYIKQKYEYLTGAKQFIAINKNVLSETINIHTK